MVIGVPKEVKSGEHRVALTPAGAEELVSRGHQVWVERGAGAGSGIEDAAYAEAGAKLVTAQQAWEAELVVKVKEPQPSEYGYLRPGLILFTFLHLAAEPQLTEKLLQSQVHALGYETVQLEDGSLPLLTPMSEVAGRLSVQIGAHFLEKNHGGRGILLGGVAGVEPGHVVIVGGGVVGTEAAKIAYGLRARVTLFDINPRRLRQLEEMFEGRVVTRISSKHALREAVRDADLLIGAVLLPGARAPKLVTEEMVRSMRPGSVIIDVAIDQGGIVETADRVTSHDEPVYEKHGVLHYAVPNIPALVPHTSTVALTNATLPYVLEIANKGLSQALSNPAIQKGLNVSDGKIVHPAVKAAFEGK